MTIFQNKKPVIAIDGTAGSGKGTLAKNLAMYLGYSHLDTGYLYRIMAWEFKKRNKNWEMFKYINLNTKPFIENTELANELRSEEISKLSSSIAKKKIVRDKLIVFQREFADNPPCGKGSVIDGRDIASVIVPKAEVKFFIDADVKIRARRRQNQLKKTSSEYKTILAMLIKRDFEDKNRKFSPLTKTPDSFILDSTSKNEKEILNEALDYIKKKRNIISDCI